MMPVRSADGINSSGDTIPFSGCCQRNKHLGTDEICRVAELRLQINDELRL
jgi:hypothetical protein